MSAGSTFITTCTYQTSLDLYCSEFNITREEAQQKLANSVNLARTCLNSKELYYNMGEVFLTVSSVVVSNTPFWVFLFEDGTKLWQRSFVGSDELVPNWKGLMDFFCFGNVIKSRS